MSEQKTAKRNWHSIVGANGMCECGVDAAGAVTTCGQLHQAERGVSPGDLRARIEQLPKYGFDGYVTADGDPIDFIEREAVLALLGAAQEQP